MTALRVVSGAGVFAPLSDSWMLARAVEEAVARRLPGEVRVLDVGTGSGAIAAAAARRGARVTAVDRSRRAVLAARLTGYLNGVRVRALRGDLLAPVAGERFDVIASNPPYIPAPGPELPPRGRGRATDAGLRGRAILDRLCAAAPAALAPGGELLLIHSEVCGEAETLAALRRAGLAAEVIERHRGPLGPLLRSRRALLEARGLLAPGARDEELVIVRGSFRPGRLG